MQNGRIEPNKISKKRKNTTRLRRITTNALCGKRENALNRPPIASTFHGTFHCGNMEIFGEQPHANRAKNRVGPCGSKNRQPIF
jgi:hypothetical protein